MRTELIPLLHITQYQDVPDLKTTWQAPDGGAEHSELRGCNLLGSVCVRWRLMSTLISLPGPVLLSLSLSLSPPLNWLGAVCELNKVITRKMSGKIITDISFLYLSPLKWIVSRSILTSATDAQGRPVTWKKYDSFQESLKIMSAFSLKPFLQTITILR